MGDVGRVLTESLGTSLELGNRLLATESSSPVVSGRFVLLSVVDLDGRDELGELSLVLRLDFTESENGSSLATDDGTETSLALDDSVGDTHLAAESGEEDDELDRVDIISDDDEVGLLVLDEGDDVVESRLDEEGLLGLVRLLSVGEVGSLGLEANLLLLLRLSLVLVQETEELSGSVLVEDVGELSDRGRSLETLVEDNLLTLKTNVLGPLNEAGEVSGRANRLTDAERLGTGLEERVGSLLRGLGLARGLSDFLGRGLDIVETTRGGKGKSRSLRFGSHTTG